MAICGGRPMSCSRYSVAILAAASVIGATVAVPAPAYALKAGRALGIVGGVAVGAIILNEASKQRRAGRTHTSSTKRSGQPKEAKADGDVAESGEAQIRKGSVTEASDPGSSDPFAGVASNRPVRTGD